MRLCGSPNINAGQTVLSGRRMGDGALVRFLPNSIMSAVQLGFLSRILFKKVFKSQ